jgi:phosphotransferase system HPr (HPr) family protein
MTQQFEGSIRIHKGPAIADARSVLELLALAAEPGSELVIEVTGQDAAAVLRDVAHLLEAP